MIEDIKIHPDYLNRTRQLPNYFDDPHEPLRMVYYIDPDGNHKYVALSEDELALFKMKYLI